MNIAKIESKKLEKGGRKMAVRIGDLTFFDVNEISKKFYVNPATIRRYMREQKLKGRKIGRKWYLTEEALKDYFNQQGDEKLSNVDA